MPLAPRLLVAALVLLPLAANRAAADAPLLKAKTIRCKMTTNTLVAWRNGKATSQTKPEELDFTFDQIDLDHGTAHLVGNLSAGDILVVRSLTALHFIETTGAGVDVTTVFDLKPPDQARGFVGVETRHMAPGPSLALSEEIRGTCAALE